MDFLPKPPHTSSLPSLDLASYTRKHAVSRVLAATATRRNLLDARDDVLLATRLGKTHEAMIHNATVRRGNEAMSRHAELLSDTFLRPGSRMATLARVEGGEVFSAATSRGLFMAEGGRSPHRLPSSPRQSRELRSTLAGLLDFTTSSANPRGAADLAAQPPTAGLGRTAEQQTRRMERGRRSASADTARRKHAMLTGEGPSAGPPQPVAAPAAAALPQRIAKRTYVVSLEGLPGGGAAGGAAVVPGSGTTPPHSAAFALTATAAAASSSSPRQQRQAQDVRVLPPRTTVDQFGLPCPAVLTPREARAANGAAGEAALAAEASAAAAEGRRPLTASQLSPFSPHRLLPRLGRTAAPAFFHAPEAGRSYPGSPAYYCPAWHSFRDREVARELGPSRAVTGVVAAEPRRVFTPGRPGVVDASATAALEGERAARGYTHPAFPQSPRAHRVNGPLDPYSKGTTEVRLGAVPEGGCDMQGDGARRERALGRPYMLHPRHCDELRMDAGHPWRAWSSPVQRAPDDARKPLALALPAALPPGLGGSGADASGDTPPLWQRRFCSCCRCCYYYYYYYYCYCPCLLPYQLLL